MAVAHALAAEAPSLGVKLDREVEKLREVRVVSCCAEHINARACSGCVFHSLLRHRPHGRMDTGVQWHMWFATTCD